MEEESLAQVHELVKNVLFMWNSKPFAIYVDTAIEFPSELEEDVQIDCPAGCAQDLSAGAVYGGDPSYTEVRIF